MNISKLEMPPHTFCGWPVVGASWQEFEDANANADSVPPYNALIYPPGSRSRPENVSPGWTPCMLVICGCSALQSLLG